MELIMLATRDAITNAQLNNYTPCIINKSSLANAVAGQQSSLWRAATTPAQAAIPTAPALCNKALLGSLQFPDKTAPETNYSSWASLTSSISATTVEVHDRLVHTGGLVLNVTTLQPITGLSLSTLAPSAARLGSANYSTCQWYLDVYADGGATASNATISVTYDDDSAGNLNVLAVGGTLRAGRKILLSSLIPTAKNGLNVKSITGVQLSASTGTAGNFGFSCTVTKTAMPLNVANKTEVFEWSQIAAQFENDACLELVTTCGSTSTGTLTGQFRLMHG